jgi:hypothetical protein
LRAELNRLVPARPGALADERNARRLAESEALRLLACLVRARRVCPDSGAMP